jgi:hypothetical protein
MRLQDLEGLEEMDMKSFKKVIAVLGVVAVGMVLATTATAECGNLKAYGGALVRPQSWDGVSPFGGASLLLASEQESDPIVGLWKITLTAEGNVGIPDGTVIDKGFAQWHSDGTEILNSSREPVTGSFCLGVWKKVGSSRYKLNHFAISWDQNSNLVGPGNIHEDVTLSHNGKSFTGTFTIDQYDQSGNTLAHIAGSVSATRLTVDTPVSILF